MVLATACGSPSGTGPGGDDDDGGGGTIDAGVLPGFDAPPPTGLFPLQVSADGTHLTGHDGKPFLLHGEAAWSLIVQLTTSDTMRYLSDRHARGVNAIITNLIEHQYSDHPPSNAAGNAPFTKAGDFSTPSEAYFGHVDAVIDAAASQGMVVMLFPAYLGLMVSEGWRDEMSKMATNGAAKCTAYGNFLGQRYAGKTNIMWMWGGDDTPINEPAVESCLKAIRDAILAATPGAIASAHWAPESTSLAEPAFTSSIHAVGVYSYFDDLQTRCRDTRALSPVMPTFMIETCYEGEDIRSCNKAPFEARRRQFWGWLACGAGQIYGIGGMWQFSSGWPDKLGSPVSRSASRLRAIAEQVAWNTLSPDDALVTAGRTTPSRPDLEIIASRTADHKQAVIYMPPGGPAQITVDLGRLSGAVTALWQDPTADHSIAAGDGLTGSHVFTRPAGNNDGGDNDWALVLQAQ